jgi:RNA polymerase sigma factor (TIGR02999 family)
MAADPAHVTLLLDGIATGRASAAEELLPLVYDELRALAAGLFRRQRANHTLQPTALVHEAYARMVGAGGDAGSRFEGRAHFMAVAAKAMRHILANHARDRGRQKRGGDWQRVTLGDPPAPEMAADFDLVAVDEALTRLAELDPRQCRIVELRFFADLTVHEIARVMDVSVSTAEREWRMARAWLGAELGRSGGR